MAGKHKSEEAIDDWKLDFNFNVFSQHQTQKVYSENLIRPQAAEKKEVSSSNDYGCMLVDCVEALTPVDMVNLGSGIHDATGHCCWSGAFLFVDALHLLSDFIANKRVVELGCGTGIGGISSLCSNCAKPSFLALTDADPDAMELCLRNCHLNHLPKASYVIHELTWGNNFDSADLITSVGSAFDSVLATDVLYDIGLLPPLFETAVQLLTCSTAGKDTPGIFILSHVPRACYSSDHPPVENLEEYIVLRAEEFGFLLETQIRPSSLSLGPTPKREKPNDALNALSNEEMEAIGASIFVFKISSGTKGNIS